MLEVFAAVMVHAGVSAAARALQISQPSVSRMIDDLERATRLLLFVKRGRAVVPTAQAVALFREVENSFIGLRQIALRAQQLHQHQRGQLSVGCLPALGHALMPAAIAELREKLPEITIYLQIEASLSIAQMVAAMRLDLGFVAANSYPTGVHKIATLAGPCRCILPNGHPLASAGSVSLGQLAGEPFVALSSHSRIRQRVEAAAPDAARLLKVVAETRQSSSASELVLRGVGVSIVDPWVAHEHVRRGGASLRLSQKIEYETDVIAHADSRPSEGARALLAHVSQQARAASD